MRRPLNLCAGLCAHVYACNCMCVRSLCHIQQTYPYENLLIAAIGNRIFTGRMALLLLAKLLSLAKVQLLT